MRPKHRKDGNHTRWPWTGKNSGWWDQEETTAKNIFTAARPKSLGAFRKPSRQLRDWTDPFSEMNWRFDWVYLWADAGEYDLDEYPPEELAPKIPGHLLGTQRSK